MTEIVKNNKIEFLENVLHIESPTDEMIERLPKLLHKLSDKERIVISFRYGFYDGRKRTLQEIGRQYNVTRERIRQIIVKAIKRMRHPTRKIIILIG